MLNVKTDLTPYKKEWQLKYGWRESYKREILRSRSGKIAIPSAER